MSDPDDPAVGVSAVTLREQIYQLAWTNAGDQGHDIAFDEYIKVARLTLDAMEAEIGPWWLHPSTSQHRTIVRLLNKLRAQLTVSRQPEQKKEKDDDKVGS